MANLTRDQILARKTGRGISTLPDGATVAIRGLTRDEALELNEGDRTVAQRDNFIVSKGMTDPTMSEEDVAVWAAQGDAGDLVAVSNDIAKLSGMVDGADKGAYKSVPGEPGS